MTFLLQQLITVNANVTQNPLESIDIGPYKTVIVRVRRVVASTAGQIRMQDALRQSESDFNNVGATITLTATGDTQITITDGKRFLRWSTVQMNGTNAQFMIEVFVRET
jgi:hypothetical protein